MNIGKLEMYNHKVLPKPISKFPFMLLYRGKLRTWTGRKLENL